MAQMRIFLSHSSADKRFADMLVHALRQADADVWYDEHDLGAGILRDEIMHELADRPVFLVLLSSAAFASSWVRDECEWAYNLFRREPGRLLLPVTAAPYEARDFNALLYLESLKRIEAAGNKPYSEAEAVERTLGLLGLTAPGQALAIAPNMIDDVDELDTRGTALDAQGRVADAVAYFERATQLAPDKGWVWDKLAYGYLRLRQWGKCLAAATRALQVDPRWTTSWLFAGTALVHLNRFEEGLAALTHAAEADPELVTAMRSVMASALVGLDRVAEADPVLTQHLAEYPNDADMWQLLGIVRRRLNRPIDALAAYERALALSPDNVAAWLGKGDSLSVLGRAEEALSAFDSALALGSNQTGVWEKRAFALKQLNRDAEALVSAERALALNPQSTASLVRSAALLALGNYRGALEAADAFLSVRPSERAGWTLRALALHSLGREAEAQEAEVRAKEISD